ncbi:MAG: hypothetical protein AAGJ95_11010 [Cyanobacteria bacterium J06554_11]
MDTPPRTLFHQLQLSRKYAAFDAIEKRIVPTYGTNGHHTSCQISGPSNHPSIRTATALIAIVALAGCHSGTQPEALVTVATDQPATDQSATPPATPQAVVSDSTTAPKPEAISENANRSETTLPSMSAYTLQKTQGRQTNRLPSGTPWTRGPSEAEQYCFRKSTENSWLSIRLELSDNQELFGESVGTLNHPQKGQVNYQQTFAGKLADTQALVEVTTHIAGLTDRQEEAWKLDREQLDMGRVVLNGVPCMDIAADF